MCASLRKAASFCLGLSVLASLLPRAGASDFLGRANAPDGIASGPELERTILAEVNAMLGSDARGAARLAAIEAALRPTFRSMQKNGRGKLGQKAVRYALHRLFVQRHGWFVRGLEPDGDGSNDTSPVGALKGRAPEQVVGRFEALLGDHGLGLHELAALAATLESLVHREAVGRLQLVYGLHNLSSEASVDLEVSGAVMDTYMASYVLQANLSAMDSSHLEKQSREVTETYPNWPEVKSFVREVREQVKGLSRTFTFADILAVVEEVGERFGTWQNKECVELKRELVEVGAPADREAGRVRLSDFYSSALGGKWQFSESVRYLRQLGALDESDPEDPAVIVANYINGPSNCVSSSGYYSVCCVNECEGLMGQLEDKLRKPDATPEEISALVTAMPSASMPARRTLAEPLQARLGEIARHHGGVVPLHGRLFAQWMHHAYPLECPYPHLSGTTKPLPAEEYEAVTGQEINAAREELEQYAERKPARRGTGPSAISLPWHLEEELYVPWEAVRPSERTPWAVGRAIVLVLALTSVTGGILRALAPLPHALGYPASGRKQILV